MLHAACCMTLINTARAHSALCLLTAAGMSSTRALVLHPLPPSASQLPNMFTFASPGLTLAGSYSVSAEYKEARPQLAAALGKEGAKVSTHRRGGTILMYVRCAL